MAFLASLIFLVLFAKVAAHVKKPMILAAGFALLVMGVQWFTNEMTIERTTHDLLIRLAIRFVLAWILFAILTRSSSVLVWVLTLALSPLLCLV